MRWRLNYEPDIQAFQRAVRTYADRIPGAEKGNREPISGRLLGFRKFDTFSMDYDVVNYALTKEIVEAWGQKQPNESDVYWTNRILYLQQFASF